MSATTSGAASSSSAPAPLIAALGWILPGAGYFLIGQKLRGAVIGVTILAMFIFGVLLAGIRVIDVPGFDDHGHAVYYQMQVDGRGNATETKIVEPKQNTANITSRWSMLAHPFLEITNKPWFVPQVVTGPICLAAAHWSNLAARPVETHDDASVDVSGVQRSHGRIYEIGTLYTAIAGMLNLLAIIDASSRAGGGN